MVEEIPQRRDETASEVFLAEGLKPKESGKHTSTREIPKPVFGANVIRPMPLSIGDDRRARLL
jgi:hypothetical protein